MFDRFRRSFVLVGASWRVLMEDRKLLVFPLCSGVAVLAMIASFMVPLWFYAASKKAFLGYLQNHSLTFYAVCFVAYLLGFFISTFFQTALTIAAMSRFDGRPMPISIAFRSAASKTPDLLAFSVIEATVGTIIQGLEQRLSIVGSIVAAVLGCSWTVFSALAVPALAANDIGPFDALRSAAHALRKRWGEALIGSFGIAGVGGTVQLLVIAIGVAMVPLTHSVIPALAFMFAGILSVVWIMGTLDTIFRAAIYRFAMTGDASHFDADALDEHFQR